MTTPIDFHEAALKKDIEELRKLHGRLLTPDMRRAVQDAIEELERRYRRQ